MCVGDGVYHVLEKRVREALREFVQRKYGVEMSVVTEQPPKIEMGEVASPVCFELAKRLKRAPRQIAQEIAAGIGPMEGVARWEVAGGGYLNAYFDRAAFFENTVRGGIEKAFLQEAERVSGMPGKTDKPKIVVEHTNINPNKAAHIGHLRNAALGDTFVRLLRAAGQRVEVQNYIDNTGVQVADVVVGLVHLEKKTPADVRTLAAQPKFDTYCWDLYARVTQFFEEDKTREKLRGDALKTIEEGHGAEAEIAETVSTAIVRCHLRTMQRLGVEYDLLPRESEILSSKFWDAAFALLKERGAIQLSTSGKTAGCWVMKLGGSGDEGEEVEDAADTKIIVRSNGTVTYVGKDIAYQMWKFGLLGKDFRYELFEMQPSGHRVWATTAGKGDPAAPKFGNAAAVYNVIDSRQSYLQKVVVAGLRALGFAEQADRSTHFAYEMVALSQRCAAEMGYVVAPEDAKKPYVEVSGRRGQGVKADDLLDRLEANARAEVDARSPEDPEEERTKRAHQIAIAALRYFLLKYTRNTVIAFDFKEALSFDGETGPYCQYAVVRAQNIFRKWGEQAREKLSTGLAAAPGDLPVAISSGTVSPELMTGYLAAPAGDELWELVLLAGSLESMMEKAVGAQEPAFVAKYAFQLAQEFNNFYHKHHILSEADEGKKAFLLALTMLVQQQLAAALGLLGIEAPGKM